MGQLLAAGRTVEQQRRARRLALQRARRCTTCRCWQDLRDRKSNEPCLGCGDPLDYYTCSPGYCRACAHDPGWVKLSDVVEG